MPRSHPSLITGGLLLFALVAADRAETRYAAASPAAPPANAEAEIPACPQFDVPDDTVVTVTPARPSIQLRNSAALMFDASTLPRRGAIYRITRAPSGKQRAEIGVNPASRGSPVQFKEPVRIELSYRDCNWTIPANKRVFVLRTDLPSPDSIGGVDVRDQRFVQFTTYHFTDFALAIP